MSENIVARLAQVNLRSDEYVQQADTNSSGRNNGEDTNRSNPWRPINTGENIVLEADAWPEPSAPGEQRRNNSLRQPEEKLRRKIKWQNYEVDQTASSYFRGRGRGNFYGHHFAPQSASPLRRGGFRGRVSLDNSKNVRTNGYFTKYGGRPGSSRTPPDSKEEKYPDTSLDIADGTSSAKADFHGGRSVAGTSKNNDSTKSQLVTTETLGGPSTSSTNPGTQSTTCEVDTKASCSTQPFSKRNFRERPEPTASYEAGPLGRARRSYLRQNPFYAVDSDGTSDQNALFASNAMASLIPFHSVAPIAYIIPGAPGVAGTLWGTGLQLAPGSTPQLVSASGSQLGVPPAVSPTQRLSEDMQSLSRVDEDAAYLRPSSVTSATNSVNSKSVAGGDIFTELVDVHQMIAYVNEVGWNKVVFPSQLRNHPTIAAIIGNSTNSDAGGLPVVSSDTKAKDNDTANKVVKPEDVVIVEDQVFFVPRNANKTKFLKFTCKLDYIRHHVEYYFSEANLSRDNHLVSILEANNNVCPIDELLQFNRLRWVSTTDSELLDAVSRSQQLIVTSSPEGYPLGVRRSFEHTFGMGQHSSSGDAAQHRPQDKRPGPGMNGFDKADTSSSSFSNPPNEPGPLPPNAHSELSNIPAIAPITGGSSNSGNLSVSRVSNQFVQPTGFTLGSSTNHQSPSYASPNDHPGPVINPSSAFTHSNYYSPQQAALLTSNALAHQSVPTSLSANMQPSDIAPTLMPAFYRVAAPGHLGSTMGAYFPHLAGSSAFPLPTSSGLFLQFVPSQPALSGGYQHIGNPLISRSTVGSINPAGMWVPVATGGNNATQTSANSMPQGFPTMLNVPNLANIPFANTNNYTTMLPSLSANIPFNPFTFPVQNMESPHATHTELKVPEESTQGVYRQQVKAGGPSYVPQNTTVCPSSVLPNTISTNELASSSNYFAVYGNRSSTAPPTFTDSCPHSSRTTPKKAS